MSLKDFPLDLVIQTPKHLPAIVYGSPGVGKCLPGDELILDATTGAYVPIRDFDMTHQVAAFVNGELLKVHPAIKMNNGRKPIFRVRTQTGRELRTTGNHPFLVLVEGSKNKFTDMRWVQAQDLSIGTMVAVAHRQPFFGTENLSENEIKVMALLISEGSLYSTSARGYVLKRAQFTNSDPKLLLEFEECVTRLGFELCRYNSPSGWQQNTNATTGVVTTSLNVRRPVKTGFVALMERGGDGMKFVTSGRKEIPQIIFKLHEDGVALFLRYLFSGDGWIAANPNPRAKNGLQSTIGYCSKSKKLIRQVQELLTKFGIVSGIRSVERKLKKTGKMATYWTLSISSSRDVLLFLNKIGFARTDVEKVEQAREAAKRIVANLDERQLGNRVFRFGLLFDPVKEVTEDGEDETFDLEVPVAHNFVAQGFVVHNTSYIYNLFNFLDAPLKTVIGAIHEPSDFGGIPTPSEGGMRMTAPAWAKEINREAANKPIAGIFFSEMTCAPPAIQAAMLRVIHEGVVGEEKLLPQVVRVADANPPEQAAGGWELALPLANRMTHLEWPRPSVEEWCDGFLSGWKEQQFTRVDLNRWEDEFPRAKTFIASFLRSAVGMEFLLEDPKKSESRWPQAFATPRTCENAARLLSTVFATKRLDAQLPLLAASCGMPFALKFSKWLEEAKLPDPEAVLADPNSWLIDPLRQDVTYAVLMSVSLCALKNKPDKSDRWLSAWRVLNRALEKTASKGTIVMAARTLISKDAPKIGKIPTDVNKVIEAIQEVSKGAGLYDSRR